ncbi:MAG: flagellar motor switch protein FliN [Phycisphaerales bacterium]
MPDEQDMPTPEDQTPEDGMPESEDQPTPDAEPAEEETAELNETEASALAAAMQAINQVQGVADSATETPAPASSDEAQAFSGPEFGDAATESAKSAIDMLSDVHMDVRIELGRTRMYVEDVLKLNDGAVVELDKLAGDPVDVFVNDRRVACGEVLVLNDMFCVRINEVIDITQAED